MYEEIIDYKSDPYFFYKERDNKKTNTVRKHDFSDERVRKLLAMANSGIYGYIRITNSENNHQFFTRMITDVTVFKDLLIISWRGV